MNVFQTAEKNEELQSSINVAAEHFADVMSAFHSVRDDPLGAIEHAFSACDIPYELVPSSWSTTQDWMLSPGATPRVLMPYAERSNIERHLFRRAKKAALFYEVCRTANTHLLRELVQAEDSAAKLHYIAQECADVQYLMRYPMSNVSDLAYYLDNDNHPFSSSTIAVAKHAIGASALVARFEIDDLTPLNAGRKRTSRSNTAFTTSPRLTAMTKLSDASADGNHVQRFVTTDAGIYCVKYDFDPSKSFADHNESELRDQIFSWVESLLRERFDFSFGADRGPSRISYQNSFHYEEKTHRYFFRTIERSQSRQKRGCFVATACRIPDDLEFDSSWRACNDPTF